MTPEQREALQKRAVAAIDAAYEYGHGDTGYNEYGEAFDSLMDLIEAIR